jgi:predicted nucleotidyltransferase
MISSIENNRDTLDSLCVKYHVKHLEVFGSAATDEYDPDSSDIDFLVEFQRMEDMTIADQYFGLLEDLRKLFNRDIDLVMTRALRNPYFIDSLNKTRRTLYASKIA